MHAVTHSGLSAFPSLFIPPCSLQESASCQPHHEAGSGSDGPGLPVCAPGWGLSADGGRCLLRADPRSRPQRYGPQAFQAGPPIWRPVGGQVTWERQPGGGSKEHFTHRPVVERVSNFKWSLLNPNKNIQMHRNWKKSWKETHRHISSRASEQSPGGRSPACLQLSHVHRLNTKQGQRLESGIWVYKHISRALLRRCCLHLLRHHFCRIQMRCLWPTCSTGLVRLSPPWAAAPGTSCFFQQWFLTTW